MLSSVHDGLALYILSAIPCHILWPSKSRRHLWLGNGSSARTMSVALKMYIDDFALKNGSGCCCEGSATLCIKTCSILVGGFGGWVRWVDLVSLSNRSERL